MSTERGPGAARRTAAAHTAAIVLAASLVACGGGGEDQSATDQSEADAGRATALAVGDSAQAGDADQASEQVEAKGPGVPIKPVKATASGHDGNMVPGNAIDGNLSTRWAGNNADKAWIQFDFGKKVELGYLKLTWENAYGKAYTLQVSDDGVKWKDLRKQTAGTGGIEEYFNLGVTNRYLRLQGVTRGTQYPYSLYEVEFKTPGSDNTLPKLATSATDVPKTDAYVPMLPLKQPPQESTQFTLADGTLVTRFGVVGRSRHARERGEDWNEIGYGPNETVDGAGNPVDKGPGAYLNFVPNYFKNRSWGVEIIDNSRVAGVTKPTLRVNQYYQQAQLAGGHSFFRGFDRPGVTGYGWMASGQLVDPDLYGTGRADCPVVAKPPNGKLLNDSGLNDGCSVTLDNYPGHADLSPDANGVLVPNGQTIPARALVAGDVIEFTPSFFSTREAMGSDLGGLRYYTTELTYVMGTGLRPWYGVQPRLMNAPLPSETLQGGIGSVSYDYADNGAYMFQQQQNNIGMQNMQRFVDGRRLLHTNMRTGEHNEPGNDRYDPAIGLLGPRFNQSSCFGCHVNNGRSPAPSEIGQKLDHMALRAAMLNAEGKQVPHDRYGAAVQMNAASSDGKPQDWGTGVRVKSFTNKEVLLADGTKVVLRQPLIEFDGDKPAIFSLRAAMPLIGGGLLESVLESDILSRVRQTPDADGVKGQANFVYDPETGDVRLGRFGWKASKVSLRHQAASALLDDMSVTSPLYPSRDCLAGPDTCKTGKPDHGVSAEELQKIEQYLQLLAVPAQRSLVSGFPKGVSPLKDLDVNPKQVAAGAKLFSNTLRCTSCHVAEMKTGKGHLMEELRSQTIKPYSDLLLHDMGSDLADNYTEGRAKGNMWRTPPLWGIGYTDRAMEGQGTVGYLHDGRARNLTEAVMWHGGEATASRQRFAALSAADRAALMAFLRSL